MISEQLRESVTKGHEPTDELVIEAAAELERKATEIKRLREALVQIRTVCEDNRSEDRNSAAMALRFVQEIAARLVNEQSMR